jgi:hypothetical protein
MRRPHAPPHLLPSLPDARVRTGVSHDSSSSMDGSMHVTWAVKGLAGDTVHNWMRTCSGAGVVYFLLVGVGFEHTTRTSSIHPSIHPFIHSFIHCTSLLNGAGPTSDGLLLLSTTGHCLATTDRCCSSICCSTHTSSRTAMCHIKALLTGNCEAQCC